MVKILKSPLLYVGMILFLLGCSSQRLPEEEPEFAVSPFSILKSAHSVVQDYSMDLRIDSEERATVHIRRVTTIMNRDARDNGELLLYSGGFTKLKKVEGALYASDGRLIRRLQESDGNDYSVSGSYSLYNDTRIKKFDLYHSQYPYTVVYDYEFELTGLLNLPTFKPQSPNQYVQNARLTVHTPKDLKLKYRLRNLNVPVRKKVAERDSIFSWEIENLEPVTAQPFGSPFWEKAPGILLAVESFQMANTSGKLDSWDSLGQWYYDLSQGKDRLPESVKNDVKELYTNAASRIEGIKALYQYMQDKTRYVSVQLGIGGWRPYPAGYVEEKGYGDCKALTNYMQALLKYAGVESYPVLIKNGIMESDILTDFPSSQFNHVILWVPGQDTVWLESTSQVLPFNYIGLSNAGRHGLAVTPDSSFLVTTPQYDQDTNRQVSNAIINLDKNGNAGIDLKNIYSGYYLDELLGTIAQKSDPEREKWVHDQLPLNSFEIVASDFSDIDERKKEPELKFTLYNPRYATKSGSRLFLPINRLNRWSYIFPDTDGSRTEDIDLVYTFTETDRCEITLPPNVKVEMMPESVSFKTDFAEYRFNLVKEKGKIKMERELTVRKKKLPNDRYDALRVFFEKVRAFDKKNIVLKAS